MQTQLQRLWNDGNERWQFFRQWLRHPISTAAISPSGARLVRAMVAEIPPEAQRVIELGAGTGVMTRAILERDIAPQDLLVFELNPELARYLEDVFRRCASVVPMRVIWPRKPLPAALPKAAWPTR